MTKQRKSDGIKGVQRRVQNKPLPYWNLGKAGPEVVPKVVIILPGIVTFAWFFTFACLFTFAGFGPEHRPRLRERSTLGSREEEYSGQGSVPPWCTPPTTLPGVHLLPWVHHCTHPYMPVPSTACLTHRCPANPDTYRSDSYRRGCYRVAGSEESGPGRLPCFKESFFRGRVTSSGTGKSSRRVRARITLLSLLSPLSDSHQRQP